MRYEPASDDAAFEAEVHAFTRANWQPDPARTEGLLAELDGAPWTPALRQWFTALVQAGWSVPHWPVEQGGTGWSAARHFLFSRALAAAGAPTPVNLATGIVAPLLFQEPRSAVVSGWIDAIRGFRDRWAIASAEPATAEPSPEPSASDGPVPRTTARKSRGGYVLDGEKTWVTGAMHADYLLCLARLPAEGRNAWFVVRGDAPGVRREALAVMGGKGVLARVALESVAVDAQARLTADPSIVLPTPPLRLRAPAFQRTLASIRDTADETDDPALRRECDALMVQNQALEALEFRAAFGDPAMVAGLRQVLAVRGAELGQAVSGLRARSMGYHAVPFPDDSRFHNEGVFGDEQALPVVRQALFDRAFTLYAAELPGQGASIEALKDRMAREILGIDLVD